MFYVCAFCHTTDIDRVTIKEMDTFNLIKTVSVVDTCRYLSCDKRLTQRTFVTSSYKLKNMYYKTM
jgi:hypothetical protein